MRDFLSQLGKGLASLGKGWVENQAFIAQLSRLPFEEAAAVLRERVPAMTNPQWLGFRATLGGMIGQHQNAIQQLQASSQRSWGPTVEDRLAQATAGDFGGPTAQQAAAIRQASAWLDWLQLISMAAEQARRAPAAPPPSSPPPTPRLGASSSTGPENPLLAMLREASNRASSSPTPPAPTPVSLPPSQDPNSDEYDKLSAFQDRMMRAVGDGDFSAGVDLLKQELARDVSRGKVTPERQASLEALLGELKGVTDSRDSGSLSAMSANIGKVKDMMSRVSGMSAGPSGRASPAEFPAGSRAGVLARLLASLSQEVQMACVQARGAEQEQAQALWIRAISARNALTPGVDDARAAAIERELHRPLAVDAQRHFRRHHLTLARPIWHSPATTMRPSEVFYSGSAAGRADVKRACERLGMDLASGGSSADVGQARFDLLRRSGVGVFDLRGFDPGAWAHDLPGAFRVAGVAYELGIAFALGTPVVILAGTDGPLPFDVDVEPVRVDRGESGPRIAEGIDAALYTRHRGEPDADFTHVLDELDDLATPSSSLRILLKQLDEASSRDPVTLAAWLGSALGELGTRAPIPIWPAWPGRNAALDRVFHVTAFRGWSERVSGVIRGVCSTARVPYVRGDEPTSPDIIRTIWDELCLASRVVVDLSEANTNAALELGIAHTLGRPTLLISQHDPEVVFPAIAKLRILSYPTDDPGSISGAIAGFVRRPAQA